MAEEIREFVVSVPAGTPVAAPVTVDISFPVRVVTAISWRVPPGPSGKLGWRLTSAGTPVIPIQPGSWVITDNQADTWDLSGYLDSGNWQLTAYNTGVFPHSVYLTFLLDLIGVPDTSAGGQSVTFVSVIGSGGSVPIPPTPPAPVPAAPDPVTEAIITVVIAAMMGG